MDESVNWGGFGKAKHLVTEVCVRNGFGSQSAAISQATGVGPQGEWRMRVRELDEVAG
jgi:hypothetical protein